MIDAVTGLSMAAEDLKDGDTVYAWVGPAMMLSMPPQAHATVVVGNLPADAAAPQFYQVAEVKPQMMIAIYPPPPLTYVEFTTTDGTEVKITDKAQLTPHLTRNMVTPWRASAPHGAAALAGQPGHGDQGAGVCLPIPGLSGPLWGGPGFCQ